MILRFYDETGDSDSMGYVSEHDKFQFEFARYESELW